MGASVLGRLDSWELSVLTDGVGSTWGSSAVWIDTCLGGSWRSSRGGKGTSGRMSRMRDCIDACPSGMVSRGGETSSGRTKGGSGRAGTSWWWGAVIWSQASDGGDPSDSTSTAPALLALVCVRMSSNSLLPINSAPMDSAELADLNWSELHFQILDLIEIQTEWPDCMITKPGPTQRDRVRCPFPVPGNLRHTKTHCPGDHCRCWWRWCEMPKRTLSFKFEAMQSSLALCLIWWARENSEAGVSDSKGSALASASPGRSMWSSERSSKGIRGFTPKTSWYGE